MRCRAIHTDENGKKTVVWFGSTGKNVLGFDELEWDVATWDSDTGTSKLVPNRQNFDERQAAVASSLTQRLSVLKKELWYAMNYGLPLFEKKKSKIEFDAVILSIITQHPDVVSIKSFSSSIIEHKYSCKIEIESRYGQLSLEI